MGFTDTDTAPNKKWVIGAAGVLGDSLSSGVGHLVGAGNGVIVKSEDALNVSFLKRFDEEIVFAFGVKKRGIFSGGFEKTGRIFGFDDKFKIARGINGIDESILNETKVAFLNG